MNNNSKLTDEEKEMALESYLGDFLCDEIEEFEKNSILTKEQILSSIKKTRADYQAEANSDDKKHSTAFYEILDDLFEQFENKVYFTTLPEHLEDWWNYSYDITTSGIILNLNYYSWSYGGTSSSCSRDETFKLIEVPSKLLTVSEYAKIYNVNPVTVRQWIRRAKLRDAVKVGTEWRIPELAELSKEKYYTDCTYRWSDKLDNLPEEYAFFNEFTSICNDLSACFEQDEDNKSRFIITLKFKDFMWNIKEENLALLKEILAKYPELHLVDEEDIRFYLSNEQREKLELYFISNPFVKCYHYLSFDEAIINLIDQIGGYSLEGISVTFSDDGFAIFS